MSTFIPNVINKISIDLEALYQFGFAAIAVTNLEPIGCLPFFTFSNDYTSCIETLNSEISIPHNVQLTNKVASLQFSHINTKFILIDLYNAFLVSKGNKYNPKLSAFTLLLGRERERVLLQSSQHEFQMMYFIILIHIGSLLRHAF